MNSELDRRLPQHLLRALFQAEKSNIAALALSNDDRALAIHWLNHALMDFDALDSHIALLQELYDSPFRYPRPRRDCWTIEQCSAAVEHGNFTRFEKLEDSQIVDVMDRGIDALDNTELAQLLLNPFALFDLLDVIDDTQPEHWVSLAVEADSVANADIHSSEIGPQSESYDNKHYSSRLISKNRHASPLRWLIPATSSLALAASLIAVIIAWHAVNVHPTSESTPSTPNGSEQIEFVGDAGQEATWAEIWETTAELSDDSERLKRIVDALPHPEKEWIVSMKEAGCTDTQILKTLAKRFGGS